MKKWLCILVCALLPLMAQAEGFLVSINLAEGTANGMKAAGIGKRAPWGVHHADVVYESLLYETGQTRLTCLFQSSYPQSVGPVRSARVSHYFQRTEWNAALVYNGHAGQMANELLREHAIDPEDANHLNGHGAFLRAFTKREKGIRAPDNLSVDLSALRDATKAQPSRSPLRFGTPPTGEPCASIALDWGDQAYQTVFQYENGRYLRLSGQAPLLSYPDAQRNGEPVQLAFDAVIVQHVSYAFPSQVIPVMTGLGSGEADYYVHGQHIQGAWLRESVSSPTVYLDHLGNEMTFPEGKVYIAQFPALENGPSQ